MGCCREGGEREDEGRQKDTGRETMHERRHGGKAAGDLCEHDNGRRWTVSCRKRSWFDCWCDDCRMQ